MKCQTIMYRYQEIKEVHLELTERCNAACPMCARNINGSSILHSELDNSEIRLEDAKRIFIPDFISQLTRLHLCGNYGDSIVAKDCLEIIRYFRENNNELNILFSTNGGARSSKWWKELASILGPKGEVIFSIDGLQDTNHIYRQNVNWKILERSFKSFISAGGKAAWSFLIFRHNEHQVEKAKELAKEWGFKQFYAKHTLRFKGKSSYLAIDSINNKAFDLRPPKIFPKKDALHQSKENRQHIDCFAIREKTIYVSARQLLHPCCHTGHFNSCTAVDDSVLDLKKYSIKEILDSGSFNNIKNSWNNYETAEPVCKKLCSVTENEKSRKVKTGIINIINF